MTDPERFAIVPVEGKSPPEAIVVGPMSEVTTYIGQSIARIEEEQRLAQAQADAEETAQHQAEIRAHAAQILSDGMARLNERIDQYEARKKARADQLRRDEEEAEIARTEAMLDSLPDPDLPDLPGDSSYVPAGDLHSVAPVDKEHLDPEDVEDRGEDAVTGAMPRELDKGAPPEAGEYAPTSPLPSPYRDPPSTGGP
jgi:hypothetical protein